MPIKLNKGQKEMHLNRKLSGSERILYPVAAREKGTPVFRPTLPLFY